MLIVLLLSVAGFALAAIPRFSAFLASDAVSEPQALVAFGGALCLAARLSKWDGGRWRERIACALADRAERRPAASAATVITAE